MRPGSIMLFERLYLAAIAVEVVRIAFQWPLLVQTSGSEIWLRVVAVGLSTLLVMLASRRRKRSAALVLAALFVAGLPMVSYAFQPSTAALYAAGTVAQLALQAAAIALTFAPASLAWFSGNADEAA